ncbi:hypothetical protein Mp_4g05250 [Marchantia polymorpha subsp. ruderalis]|uniref:Uncharacterized protein n=2 Tax=Marchantia polymorpha TaxID=3197 RepID=A0AAF6B6K5_MARPO|nr:hypothetical protein MARPO_0087s0064 [Marchantia polymorpha]BBN07639.1 hypothetical protein Mp_4g05250 [Marchantia polymorpha subsp. ruderalis]|eukprot:PTQ33633.1 hypothetical protein MARPO_0087s0064 [Marchantia polymorpha]
MECMKLSSSSDANYHRMRSLFSKFYRGSRVDKGASVKIHRKLSTKMRIFVKRGLVTAGAGLVAAGISVVAAPVVVPAVVTSLGFTSAGIAGGSWAAGFMASYGGLVGAGSTCAILQSIGATGALAGSGVMAVAGAATTALGAAATALGVAVGKAGGEESADAEMAGENNCLTPAEAFGKAGVEESVDAETAAENNCLTPAVDD